MRWVSATKNALLFERISVSAGQRGLQIIIDPSDYLRATNGTLCDLTRPKGTTPKQP